MDAGRRYSPIMQMVQHLGHFFKKEEPVHVD